jgi:uncharacterized cupin superfamily protein
MPKVDLAALPVMTGTRYPAEYAGPCKDRIWQALGAAGDLTQFGVNLLTLKPGVWSSQRHWHSHEDEFVYVLAGHPTFVDDAGPVIAAPGDAFVFKAGDQNGHHFKNEMADDVVLLVVGSRSDKDHGGYSDIDMVFGPNRYTGGGSYTRRDGTPI